MPCSQCLLNTLNVNSDPISCGNQSERTSFQCADDSRAGGKYINVWRSLISKASGMAAVIGNQRDRVKRRGLHLYLCHKLPLQRRELNCRPTPPSALLFSGKRATGVAQSEMAPYSEAIRSAGLKFRTGRELVSPAV